jgi:hypothetical protein
MEQDKDKSMPIMQYRSGFIEASVWGNEIVDEDKIKTRHSVHIQKQYKKKDGSYAETNNYFPSELPQLVLLPQRCYEHIMLSTESRERDEAAPE